ncbi:carboxyltransferase domain-containing protein [Domibacillus tundrae]
MGSVGLARNQISTYSISTQGGWQLICWTIFSLLENECFIKVEFNIVIND